MLSSSPCGGDTLLHDVQSGPPGESTEQFLRRSKDQGIPLWELQTDHKYNTESDLSENNLLVSFGKSFIGPDITMEWGRGSVQSPRAMVQADRHHSF